MEKNLKNNSLTPSFLVGVMHVNHEPWLSIVRDGQIPFWSRQEYERFKVIYFHSNFQRHYSFLNKLIEHLRWQSGTKASYAISYLLMLILAPWRNSIPRFRTSNFLQSGVQFNSVKVLIPELTSTMRWKKLAMIKFFLESTEAEFLIITNSSSVLNFRPIVKYVLAKHEIGLPFYAGPIHKGHDGNFVSGSFTLINRISAETLLRNRRLIPLHVMDDIGFGTAFHNLGIFPINFLSLELKSEHEVDTLTDANISDTGHFRIKSGTLLKRYDVQIANKLLQRLGKE